MIKNLLETGINQLAHPHPSIRARLQEHSISDCEYGCKVYEDPATGTMVLHHNGTYGCRKTKAVLERESHADIFKGRNFWMVPIKDRVDQEVWDVLAVKSGLTMFKKVEPLVVGHFTEIAKAAKRAGEGMKAFAESYSQK